MNIEIPTISDITEAMEAVLAKAKTTSTPGYLSEKNAAIYMDCTGSHIRNLAAKGMLKKRKHGRLTRYAIADLDALLAD